jgi:hypothetical protein
MTVASGAVAWWILVGGVLPLWFFAGFLDYLCHRASDIEHANGVRETALHWLMFAEVGVPMLAAVFLKVNALLLLFMAACWIAHEVTTHVDLRLAIATRHVSAFEQQVHSFLEVLPVVALLLLALLHWDQAAALVGFGATSADFSLSLKPLPSAPELIALFTGILLFGIVPYLDELLRGLRARRHPYGARRPAL